MKGEVNLVRQGATMHQARLLRSALTAAILLLVLAGSAVAEQIEDGLAAHKRGDYATAMQILRPLADQGNPIAELTIGLMHVKAQGVARDLGVAQMWFKRAADNPASDQATRGDAIYNRDFIAKKLAEAALAKVTETKGQQEASTRIPISDDQAEFIAINDAARTAYKAGANDMAKGAARPVRARALCQRSRVTSVLDWVGKVATLSSNSDGKGVLSVMIGKEVYVKTWNNSFSDVTEGTLIPPQSRLYARALALRVGQVVVISGTFFKNPTDCIREASVTMDGSMTKPEFIFQFHEITPIE